MPTLLETRIEALLGDLAEYHGYRTLWLDPQGELLHAEPDDMLEELGYEYVATLLRPSRDELLAALRAQPRLDARRDDELEIALELEVPQQRAAQPTAWYPQAATI